MQREIQHTSATRKSLENNDFDFDTLEGVVSMLCEIEILLVSIQGRNSKNIITAPPITHNSQRFLS